MEILLVVSIAFLLFFYVLQSVLLKFLFRAPRTQKINDPAKYNLPFQEIDIETASGKTLFAWYLPVMQGEKRPGVVLMHGWGGNASHLLPLAPLLHKAGFSLLLLDARNHGDSASDDFPSMVQFAEDIVKGLDWLGKQEEIDSNRLSILGHSLGGAAALLAGSQHSDTVSIISIGSFAHSIPMLRARMKQLHIPYWPLGWSMLRTIQSRIGMSYEDIAPINTIRRINSPVLLIHGESDIQVPVKDAQNIYDRRKNNNVELWIISGADHMPLRQLRREGDKLVRFFDESL